MTEVKGTRKERIQGAQAVLKNKKHQKVVVTVGALAIGASLITGVGEKVSAASPSTYDCGCGVPIVQHYTVQKGDSYYKIAARFGIPFDYLMMVNSTDDPSLDVNDTVGIPAKPTAFQLQQFHEAQAAQAAKVANQTKPAAKPVASTPVASKPSTSSSKTTYVVVSGDYLSKIYLKTGVPVAQLKALNGLTSDKIYPGMILKLKETTASKPSTKNQGAPVTSKVKMHTVKTDESLWSIYLDTGVTIEDLQKINDLKGFTIFPGQILKLS